MIDQQRIEQILTNLLQNALRHTPTGGVIQISLTSQMRQQCIQVQDSGPGIPEDALPHIFERFYRADSARSRPEGGTGLGLSIARQLAEAHGGSLMAANHPNGGAVFTLCLPED
jgi:signal transduction histidine kinase